MFCWWGHTQHIKQNDISTITHKGTHTHTHVHTHGYRAASLGHEVFNTSAYHVTDKYYSTIIDLLQLPYLETVWSQFSFPYGVNYSTLANEILSHNSLY